MKRLRIYLDNTHSAFGELMERVCMAYDLPYEGMSKVQRFHGFQNYLIDQYAKGRRTILIVDEAQNVNRRGGSAIDGRTTRHHGYEVSQLIRKRIEEVFGWGKTVGPLRKTKLRGLARVGFQMMLTMAGFNLMRMRRLVAV